MFKCMLIWIFSFEFLRNLFIWVIFSNILFLLLHINLELTQQHLSIFSRAKLWFSPLITLDHCLVCERVFLFLFSFDLFKTDFFLIFRDFTASLISFHSIFKF